MQYTLDSLKQYIRALQNANKGNKYDYEPILESDLSVLINLQTDKSFFGVCTVGNNVSYANFYDQDDNKIIKVNKNSQIILGFSYVVFYDETDAEVESPEGQFRGFIIQKT